MKNKLEILINKNKNVEKLTNKIAKLKIYSESERVSAIIYLYKKYFKYDLIYDTKKKMYELYYEDFMFNDKIDKVRYNLFYNICYDETIYYHFICIKNFFEKLNANNLTNSLNNDDISFVDAVYKIIKKFNMNENFNYEEFYLNKQLQLDISNDIRWLINDINKDYSFNHYELEQ